MTWQDSSCFSGENMVRFSGYGSSGNPIENLLNFFPSAPVDELNPYILLVLMNTQPPLSYYAHNDHKLPNNSLCILSLLSVSTTCFKHGE